MQFKKTNNSRKIVMSNSRAISNLGAKVLHIQIWRQSVSDSNMAATKASRAFSDEFHDAERVAGEEVAKRPQSVERSGVLPGLRQPEEQGHRRL
jgi:hypothetical protein